MNDNQWLDGSLYPDAPPPDTLNTLPEQVDFLKRVYALPGILASCRKARCDGDRTNPSGFLLSMPAGY